MLFDPAALVRQPFAILATLAIILVGKSIAAYAIVRAFGHPHQTALTIAASLAQIGEFSFILATLGTSLKLLPEGGEDLILGGAIVSIVANPFLFRLIDRFQPEAPEVAAAAAPPLPQTTLAGHIVLVGFGRVGRQVGEALRAGSVPFLVIEVEAERLAALKSAGIEVIVGNAVRPEVLAAANLASASRLVVAIPDGFEAANVVEEARRANPTMPIIARAHSEIDVERLTGLGATTVVLGEEEIARAMIARAGLSPA
jgi:CPA2 family monovalent cation:H+ antiporter-2